MERNLEICVEVPAAAAVEAPAAAAAGFRRRRLLLIFCCWQLMDKMAAASRVADVVCVKFADRKGT